MTKRKSNYSSSDTTDELLVAVPHNESMAINGTSNDNQSRTSLVWEITHIFDTHRDTRIKRLEQKARFIVHHNLDQIEDLDAFGNDIDNAFGDAVRPFIENCNEVDHVTFNIISEGLIKKIFIKSAPIKDFDPKSFRDAIKVVSQSNTEFLLAKKLIVQVNIWESLRGGGRTLKRIKTQEEFSRCKTSVVTIKNGNGTDCGYRAIALGVSYYEMNVKGNTRQQEWHNLCRGPRILNSTTRYLMQRIGIGENILKELTNIQLRLLDERLTEYQVIVINRDDGPQSFVGTDRKKVIYLENCGDHYNLIKSMTSYRRCNEYCKYCNIGYQRNSGHVCKNGCLKCRSPKVCESDGSILRCPNCFYEFDSINCFDRHQKTLCSTRKRCPICEMPYNAKYKHRCGSYFCQTCSYYYTIQPHHCFIKTLDINKLQKDDEKNNVLIAYDIEAQLVRQENGEHFHVPFLLVMNMSCDNCQSSYCEICREKWFVFKGNDCVDQFVDKLKYLSGVCEAEKASLTVFAHNNSRYDGHFIFRSMLNKQFRGFDVTMKGLGLMKVEVGNVRFIDSLLLLQAPLAKLPKMFGLKGGGKDFFPYYYRRREGIVKLGNIPKEEFGYRTMSVERALQFDEWYVQNSAKDFLYDREAEIYCRNDVRILMEAIKEFRKLFREKTNRSIKQSLHYSGSLI